MFVCHSLDKEKIGAKGAKLLSAALQKNATLTSLG
jgi:hypothetical protein